MSSTTSVTGRRLTCLRSMTRVMWACSAALIAEKSIMKREQAVQKRRIVKQWATSTAKAERLGVYNSIRDFGQLQPRALRSGIQGSGAILDSKSDLLAPTPRSHSIHKFACHLKAQASAPGQAQPFHIISSTSPSPLPTSEYITPTLPRSSTLR